MNMPFNNPRRRFLFTTATAVLAAIIGGSATALPNDASGNLDLDSNGLPRLSPDTCYAVGGVNAMGSSNFPVAFRLTRDGVQVAGNNSTTWFQANNGTFQFQPGNYQLVAVNDNPTRTARITMTLYCN